MFLKSSKSSLLAGASAVVLATALGASGVSAQTAYEITGAGVYASTGGLDEAVTLNAFDYSARSTTAGAAPNGYRKKGGTVVPANIDPSTLYNRSSASTFRSGVGGISRNVVSGAHLKIGSEVVVRINQASRDNNSGARNAAGQIELGSLTGGYGTLSVTSDGSTNVDVTVANNSHFGNLNIDMRAVDADARATVTFSGDVNLGGNVVLGDRLESGDKGRAYLVFDGARNQTISGESESQISSASKVGTFGGGGSVRVFNGKKDSASYVATFDLQVGDSDAKLRELVIGQSTGDNDAKNGGHAVFNKKVYVKNITLNSGNHDSEKAIAEFRADVMGGAISVGKNAVATFGGKLDGTTFELGENAQATFEKPVTLTGALTVNKGSTITIGSAFGQRTKKPTSATADAAKHSDVAFVDTGTNAPAFGTFGSDDKVTVVLPVSFNSGEQKLLSTDVADANTSKVALKSNALVDYALKTSDKTVVTAKKKSVSSVAAALGVSQDDARVAGDALDAVRGDAALTKVLTTAFTSGNKAEAKKLVQQMAPQTETLGGAAAVAMSVGGQVAGVSSDRLSALRSGGQYAGQTGFATGGQGKDKAFWMKPFGQWGQKSNNATHAGYKTETQGFATGLDAAVSDGSRLGVAVAYSKSDVKGKGAGSAAADIDSLQLSVYGDYTTDNYYVEGQIGFGRNDVTSTSKVASMTRRASYDTNQTTASIGAGMPLSVGEDAFVTPNAGLSYTRIGSASYTTTGARALNQKVSIDAIDAVVGSLGAKYHARIKQGEGTLVPSVRLGLSYDFNGDETSVRSKFTGGGATRTIKGAKVEQLAGTAGLGVAYQGPMWTVGADYDLNARSGYRSHAAQLKASVKF